MGAQSASEPVTNATAVKPKVDRTKLRLWRQETGREEVPTNQNTLGVWP